jgi:hypothetical protein
METSFQTISINITGPSYKDRSKPLSSQETRGFYHELVESGKDKYVIKSFPGQNNLNSTDAGTDRGMHQMSEIAYRVVGNSLFEVNANGLHTNRGEVLGVDRCIFADDGVNLYIVTDGFVYQYSTDTNLTIRVTDVSIDGALSVAFINNQFAYTFPLLTVFSDVGDGSSASSLNAVGEESDPDELVRDYTFDQVLYRFGKRTCPNWYNSGVGTPPFDRIEGQIINVGLGAIHSVNNSKEFIYWLGSDLQVYRARGGQEQVISTAAISGAIQGYSYAGDAFGEIFTLDNKTIYVLTFPVANKTWCLIEELGVNGWFELSEGVTNGRYNAGSILEVYNKILIGDRSNGNVNELDFNTYDQAGDPWRRRRVMASINGDALGKKGHRVQMSRMEFIIETGTGLLTGQGDDPQIMLEASYDGGRSWDTGTWLKIGRLGEFNIRAEWYSMKSFYDMIVRLTTSDPVAFNLYSAAIDIRLSGR